MTPTPGASEGFLITASLADGDDATGFTESKTVTGSAEAIETAMSINNVSGQEADITYSISQYDFGPDGMDNSGVGDDCIDGSPETFELTVLSEPVGTDATATTCSSVELAFDLQANVDNTDAGGNGVSSDFSWVVMAADDNDMITGQTSGSGDCLLYTSPSPRDQRGSRMPSSA